MSLRTLAPQQIPGRDGVVIAGREGVVLTNSLSPPDRVFARPEDDDPGIEADVLSVGLATASNVNKTKTYAIVVRLQRTNSPADARPV